MAMCPFATHMLLTEPKSFGKGQNGAIERIAVHHTGVKRSEPPTAVLQNAARSRRLNTETGPRSALYAGLTIN